MNTPGFWDDTNHSQEVIEELNRLKNQLSEVQEVLEKLETNNYEKK